MKVVIPFVPGKLHPDLSWVLRIEKVSPVLVEMEEDISYFRLLSSLWKERETFIIVEQDILPWPGALSSLHQCSQEWCAFPYRLSHDPGFTPALGCTKFSGSLMERTPLFWEELESGNGKHFWSGGDVRHWYGLDGRISLVMTNLTGMGWPHRHEPPVLHLNPTRFPRNA